jgi:hypothetical protein
MPECQVKKTVFDDGDNRLRIVSYLHGAFEGLDPCNNWPNDCRRRIVQACIVKVDGKVFVTNCNDPLTQNEYFSAAWMRFWYEMGELPIITNELSTAWSHACTMIYLLDPDRGFYDLPLTNWRSASSLAVAK